MRGTMLWFNQAKDLGALATAEGEKFPVEGSGFAGGARPQGRCAGAEVEFRVVESDAGDRSAVDVVLVPFVAPRRARPRRGHSYRG